MKRPDLCLTEQPDLSLDCVEAFLLDGAYDFKSPTSSLHSLRSAGIRSTKQLLAQAGRHAFLLLSNPKTYGGEPMRCFIPRHGFRFSGAAKSCEILICFECLWIYFYYESRCVTASLGEAGARALKKVFNEAFEPA